MTPQTSSPNGGLTSKVRERLILQALERKAQGFETGATAPPSNAETQWTDFEEHPGYQRFKLISEGAKKIGVASPFFQQMEGLSSSTAVVAGRELVNFSGYNYLGLSGHPAG
jgi:7-keto-8-aminopelargonate synthetase-like enzyme